VMLALLLVAARWATGKPIRAGLLAGLAVWLRPEAAVAAGLLSLPVWREHRRLPWPPPPRPSRRWPPR